MIQLPADALPVLDAAQIKDLRDLDDGAGDVLASIVEVFVTQAVAQIAELKALVAAPDLVKVKDLAHGLKGASGNLGAGRLAMVCSGLEAAAKAEDGADLAAYVAAIDTEFSAARTALAG